ncbi:SDR family NAD(P)-dependent oxidoreductase [bacterium]|nr:SDR family NAD(P)-dependent oxidoreductase [bacterium]
MKQQHNRRIWLIGATSGIGYQLAQDMAKAGHQVIVSGRNRDKLDELHAGDPEHFFPLPLDVTRFDAVQAAGQVIQKTFGGLDTVFYNSGNCIYVDVTDFQHGDFETVFQVNFMGLVYAIEVSLPLLRQGRQPYLVGMSSSAAFVGLPRAEAYGASKAAVQYLMDALRVDLAAEGLDVSTVFPGFVKTPLTDLNDFAMPFLIDVQQASRFILKGMEKRDHNIHFPKRFTFFLKLLGNLPSSWKTKLVQRTSRS